MKRSVSVFLWILVGACASGLAIGYFLHRANVDRERLGRQMSEAEHQLQEIKSNSQKLAEEANRKIADASMEIIKTQALIKQYQEARELKQPDYRTLRYWKETISPSLGVAIKYPPTAFVSQTDPDIRLASRDGLSSSEDIWLIIQRYDPNQEQVSLQGWDQTTSVHFIVGDRLFNGWKTLPSSYVLRVQSNTTSTHLIIAHSNPQISEQRLLDTLSTINFRP